MERWSKEFEGAPSWIRDHIEGVDSMRWDREVAKLEREYPGIEKVFSGLISSLPDSEALGKKEFPFAAAVIRKTAAGIEVLGRAANTVNADMDSTQHAEMVALKEAQKTIGDKHLTDCVLLSTVEPCVMCTGGALNTHVKKVVYGASQGDISGKHVKFNDSFKPFRTSSSKFDSKTVFSEDGIEVFPGYMREEVLERLKRTPTTLKETYSDPDTRVV